jgi:hypothetical protein
MPPMLLAACSFAALGMIGVLAEGNSSIGWAVLVSGAVSAFIQGYPLLIKSLSRWRDQQAVEAETTNALATHNLETIEKQELQIGQLEGKYESLNREVVRLRKINHAIGSAAQGIIAHVDLSRVIFVRTLKDKGMSDDEVDAILPPPPPMGELVVLIRSIDATTAAEDDDARHGLSTAHQRDIPR